MQKVDIKEIADKLRKKLSHYEDFKGLWIYGSRVNGKPESNSDLDMVAVFNKRLNYDQEISVFGDVLEVEFDSDMFIDLHPMCEDELNLNYIYYDEVKKGLYYAAAK